ncbi:hypothetical protein [Acidovorax sp. PRC11]|jgi:hypothetical protein|uniref:hypothetical protein n=1 Tax=Acidovorax sp. PRC11 TaxID=2962592 RepID=UPI002882A1BD|nr:hypothetical protein [Acidovorax sp. PRC11]MDT0140823.1 hypothetical protein [Acidovorax sp. PRC11]
MKRLIAEVLKRPDGSTHAVLYCLGEDGRPDQAIGNTLLEFVELSYPSVTEIEQLVTLAENCGYVANNPDWADWGINDVDLWLRPPLATPGHICISNENTSQFSAEGGQPQQFTYGQFRTALKHWQEFRELMVQEGRESLVGRRYETLFPEN